jgi:hypothetical protein
MSEPLPILSIEPTRDGLWSVNERGPSRSAIAYFPSKLGALRHAVRVAKAKRHARVAILESNGAVRLSRDYDISAAEGPGAVEVP